MPNEPFMADTYPQLTTDTDEDVRPKRIIEALGNMIAVHHDLLLRETPDPWVGEAAWLARNALELLTWTEFCCLSDSNAKRFFDDSVRDTNDIVELAKVMARLAQSEDVFNAFDAAEGVVHKIASLVPVDIDERYKRVEHAAAELGKKEWFQVYYRMLSKHVHPLQSASI